MKKQTELSSKEVRMIAKDWMDKGGFKDKQDELERLLIENRVEDMPFPPHGLFEDKSGDKFLMYFFDKKRFSAKTIKNEYDGPKRILIGLWTGFDAWKFTYVQMYEAVLGIDSAILVYNELEKQFYFRVIRELPQPKKYWQNTQYEKDIEQAKKKYKFGNQEYQMAIKKALDRLKRNSRFKKQGMVMWNIDEFLNGISYNKKLF